VRALNSRGWSDWSPDNTIGERIKTEPRFMSLPQRDDTLTNTKKIVVWWDPIQSPEDGNSPALSYSLEYDAGTNRQEWETLTGYLADSLAISMEVTAKIIRGNTYVFKLRARNIWGWGVYSEEKEIKAATRPL